MVNHILYPCVYGVMAVTKNKNISAVVNYNGKISLKTDVNNKKIRFRDRFLVRGFLFLILGIYYTLYGIYNFSKEDFSDIKGVNKASDSLNVSKDSIVVFIMFLLTTFISFFLLGFLPLKLSYYLAPKNYNIFLKRLIIAVVKMVVIYVMFLLLKSITSFKAYFMFNDACNKRQKQVGQVNFLNYFICSVFLNVFVLSLFGMVANKWYFGLVNLIVSLLIFTINYEFYLQIQNSKYLSLIISPFTWLFCQKSSHLEQKCVNIVLQELEFTNDKRDKMQDNNINSVPFSEAYVQMKELLTNAGKYEQSDLDYIFCEVLKKSRAELRLVKSIDKDDLKKITKVVKERASGRPITKIFGYANFYGLNFIVTNDVLSPRMDTERLVETVLKDIKPKQSVLDIGTGSGAIAITIAKNSSAKVTAVDISNEALKVAKENAKINDAKVNFVKSDLFESLGRFVKYDIIVSNPPYIPTKDIDSLDEEVKKYDPLLALDGGVSGLGFYEKIIAEAPKKLTKNGKIYFEVGIGQASNVKKLLQKNFKDIRIVKDYNKIDRVVCATLI